MRQIAFKSILGIDPGLTSTGWVMLEMDKSKNKLGKIKAYGLINPSGTVEESLLQIHSSLERVILEYRPDVCSLEDVFVFRDPIAALKLGMAKGVCILCMRAHGVPIVQWNPSYVKRVITGYGKARKEMVRKAVDVLLLSDFKNIQVSHHITDAAAIALCTLLSQKL